MQLYRRILFTAEKVYTIFQKIKKNYWQQEYIEYNISVLTVLIEINTVEQLS